MGGWEGTGFFLPPPCPCSRSPLSSSKENGRPWHRRSFIQVRFFLPARAEKQDVHAFLLENLTNGGILELMMRYLKGMGHKFLLRWPPGLAEVVLSIYHSWRRHSTSLPNPLLRDCSNRHIKVGRVEGLSRASVTLGPGNGHRDLLWVWGCCCWAPGGLKQEVVEPGFMPREIPSG